MAWIMLVGYTLQGWSRWEAQTGHHMHIAASSKLPTPGWNWGFVFLWRLSFFDSSRVALGKTPHSSRFSIKPQKIGSAGEVVKNELFFQSHIITLVRLGAKAWETLQSKKSKPLKKIESVLSASLDFVGYSLPLLCSASCLLESRFANGRI